jgi:hypothetical protein
MAIGPDAWVDAVLARITVQLTRAKARRDFTLAARECRGCERVLRLTGHVR